MEKSKPSESEYPERSDSYVTASAPGPSEAITSDIPIPPPRISQPTNTSNGMAIQGLVVALVGLVLFWVPILGLVLSTLGIIFSASGVRNSNNHAAPHKGLSIAGIIASIIGIIVGLLYMAIFLVFLFEFGKV